MNPGFRLFPPQASTIAGDIDLLYFGLVAITVVFSGLIFLAVLVFALRYRRRHRDEIPRPVRGSLVVELAWTLIPLAIAMGLFTWSATLFFRLFETPADASDIYVVGKQWMWKVQHPEGRREINELHVPTGRRFRLVMTSEDVIHSFFMPAFRQKMDVLPGRYTTQWFEATKVGQYHLFCAEYCGTNHSRMIGSVYVMSPEDFESWLIGGPAGQSMSAAGEGQFQQLGCANCHAPGGRCPVLGGVYNSPVKLQDGRTVRADESYIRESILHPSAKIVAGYPNLMPTFQGQVSEDVVLQLIAYIRSLGGTETGMPSQVESGGPRTAPQGSEPLRSPGQQKTQGGPQR